MNNVTAQERLEHAHAELVQAVRSLTSGEDWQRMLDVASKFHHYSPANCLLILAQCPDATRIAGYKRWQELGRQVRKGEHGIRVLAPIITKQLSAVDLEPEAEPKRRVVGFRTVPVFDIAQTDGEPLAEVAPDLLAGDAPSELWEGLERQVKEAGYTLERGECGSANGRTDFVVRSVRVRCDVEPAQACKTLAHELAHVLLHAEKGSLCRGVVEVEAESVAYLVCQSVGLSSSGYSFPYIAGWAAGDVSVIQQTAERVITTARTILATIERKEQPCA